MNPETMTNAAVETAKVAPPATVATLTFFGYPVAEAVQFLMLLYALGLLAGMAWKFFRWIRRRGWAEA
jgi:hypothetical protein